MIISVRQGGKLRPGAVIMTEQGEQDGHRTPLSPAHLHSEHPRTAPSGPPGPWTRHLGVGSCVGAAQDAPAVGGDRRGRGTVVRKLSSGGRRAPRGAVRLGFCKLELPGATWNDPGPCFGGPRGPQITSSAFCLSTMYQASPGSRKGSESTC